MTITLDLTAQITDVNGKPFEPNQTGGQLLALVLANASAGNALKFWQWALTMNKGERIALDLADYQVLYEFVDKSQTLTVLARAQLLLAFMAAKEAASKG